MNIYKLLKLFNSIKSNRVKLLGILGLYLLRKRYLSIYIDPVMACNFRCRMCYFSGNEYINNNKGTKPIDIEDYKQMAKSIFHRALKLQIGCGAEPSLYNNLVDLVIIAKDNGVPYVSITSNAKLLNYDLLDSLISAGLNELTISAHGLKKATYEYFMQNGNYDVFLNRLDDIRKLQYKYPSFALRVNYTINEDNFEELVELPNLFSGINISVLQIRPVQKTADDSIYQNYSYDSIISKYNIIFPLLQQYCEENNTLFIFPTIGNLKDIQNETANDSFNIQQFTYIYTTPTMLWHEDYDYRNESFEDYCKRTNYAKHIMKIILLYKNFIPSQFRTRHLTYNVK